MATFQLMRQAKEKGKEDITMLKLETVLKKLRSEGIKAEFAYLSGENEPIKIIRVDCDYFGPYPPKETFDIIKTARRIAKGRKTETRGHYTALFIY